MSIRATVEFFECDGVNMRLATRHTSDGTTYFFEGEPGHERIVRSTTADGSTYLWEGPSGDEACVYEQLPGVSWLQTV